MLYNSICEADKQKLMNNSARKGILNLIPKGEKDTRYLKNLRPITLLNSDYKIVEKMIANRMVPALEQVINEDQRGFLPNRRISVNIRKILDITFQCQKQDNIILSCDYMKCFDRVETPAIIKSMEYFGFSERLRKWVTIIYSDFKIRIQNNGNFSDPVSVGRSVRQGGPASNGLFLVVAELLANSLRDDVAIKGVYVKDIRQFLNQYADDMDICLAYDQRSLERVLNHINIFQKSTGFKLNYDKTTVYRVGSLAKSAAKLYTQHDLKMDKRINKCVRN